MEEIIGAIIFIVVILLSVAQRWREGRQAAQRRERRTPRAEDLPDATRRMLYGEDAVREAKRKEHPEIEEGPVTPGRALFDALFGEDVEGEWQPVHQPAERKELSREHQEPARPVPAPIPTPPRRAVPQQSAQRRPTPQRQPAAPPKIPPKVTNEQDYWQRKKHEAKKAEMEARRITARRTAAPPPGPARLRRELFMSLDEVRRGVVMAEVLGPPKGLQ